MLQELILKAIRFYQIFISPFLGKNCRFFPSCSEYSFLAIKKYGVLKGVLKTIKRIKKCFLWHPGGIDFP